MSKFEAHLRLLLIEGQKGDASAYHLHRELAGQPDADIPALAKVHVRRFDGNVSPTALQIVSSMTGVEVQPDIATAKANFLQSIGQTPGLKKLGPMARN